MSVLNIIINPHLSPQTLKQYENILPLVILSSVYQSLWCCTFRLKYVQSNNIFIKGLSTFFLSLTSIALTKLAINCNDGVMFVGFKLHAAWTVAASLVNLSGCLSYSSVSTNVIKIVSWVSVFGACFLGGFISFLGVREFSFVEGWALKAVGDGMRGEVLVDVCCYLFVLIGFLLTYLISFDDC